MQALQGQMHEFGIHINNTNYIGEVGATTYISPNQSGNGVLYKRNFTTRFAIRAELGFAKISANDQESEEPARKARKFSFENDLFYGNAILEFNYLDFDLGNLDHTWTPYLFAGIGYHNYNELFYENPSNETAQYEERESSWGIPFGLGIKTKLTRFLVLGAEVKALHSFSDNLDGSFPTFGSANTEFSTQLSNAHIFVWSPTLLL
jgi:opacity protein-like surface antigen